MALKLQDSDKFEVISSLDEAVGCSEEEYVEYLDTLDEDLLKLNPELQPTRFVLKRVIPYEARKYLDNQKLGLDQKTKNMSINLGYTTDEVRFTLIDIVNPGHKDLEYKKDGDGFASKVLMEKLSSYGIVQELFTARQTAMKSKASVSKKS